MGWLILLCVVLFAFGVWSAVSPETVFWKLTAWQYRNPEAVEPSEISYGLHRIGGVVTCVIAVIVAGAFLSLDDDADGSSSDNTPTSTAEAQGDRDPIADAEALAAQFDDAVRRIAGERTRVRRADVEAAADDLRLEITYPEGFRARVVTVEDPSARGTLGVVACVRFPPDLTEPSETGYSIGSCEVVL